MVYLLGSRKQLKGINQAKRAREGWIATRSSLKNVLSLFWSNAWFGYQTTEFWCCPCLSESASRLVPARGNQFVSSCGQGRMWPVVASVPRWFYGRLWLSLQKKRSWPSSEREICPDMQTFAPDVTDHANFPGQTHCSRLALGADHPNWKLTSLTLF